MSKGKRRGTGPTPACYLGNNTSLSGRLIE